MHKASRILALLLLSILACKAQNKEPSDFIPKGYTEFEKHFGDLNKDGQDDCVLLIKKTDTQNDINRRGIIVLFKNGKDYQLADKNYDCFSSENEDGGTYFAPELSIKIKREKLFIHYGHGRYGHWKYTFRFQNSNFELIGYDSSSNNGPITETKTSINFLSKKKLIRENTNENAEGGDELFKKTWSDIQIESLIKLSEIKDFDELNMYDY